MRRDRPLTPRKAALIVSRGSHNPTKQSIHREETAMDFKEGSIMQVAYVVRDLEAAMKRHVEVCGIGPWSIWKFTPEKVQNYIYRGKPATHTCLIACSW